MMIRCHIGDRVRLDYPENIEGTVRVRHEPADLTGIPWLTVDLESPLNGEWSLHLPEGRFERITRERLSA